MVPWVCFLGNTTLACFKVFVGYVTGSKGLVADGMHSGSDVIATIMVIVSLHIAERKDDETHPWGHGKIEFAGAVFVYAILFSLSIYLFQDALRSILSGAVKPPNLISAAAAAVSIIANFILSGYGFCAGKQLNSPAMVANANENRADMLSSIAVIIGILGANMGYVTLDAFAAMLVALIIFKTALTLGVRALRDLLDASLPDEKTRLVRNTIRQFPEVKGIRTLKLRRVGQSVWVDVEVFLDPKKTVKEGYAVVRDVRLALIRRFRHIKEITISFTCRENLRVRSRRLPFFRNA